MAGTMLDEKLAAIKPDEHYVLVKSPGSTVMLSDGHLTLPDSASLRVPFNQLSLTAYQHIVIVENLDVFDELPAFSLPLEGEILLVYRGHDGIAKGVKALLQAMDSIPVYWFGDLDPKGLQLALSCDGAQFIISADVAVSSQKLNKLSNEDKWLEQHEIHGWFDKNQWQVHPLVRAMMTCQWAIMQQHLLAHQLPLKIYPIRD